MRGPYFDTPFFVNRNPIAPGGSSPLPFGLIYNKDFSDGSASEYEVNNGAGTISIVGANLRMAGASGGITSNIQYSTDDGRPFWFNLLERWRQRVRFIASTGASSFGFSVGVMSHNADFGAAALVHAYARLAQDTGNVGGFFIYSNVNGAITQTSNGSYALVNGQTYEYEVERNKNVLTCRLYASDGVTLLRTAFSRTFDITTLGFSSISNNVGRFCLINHGGTNDIIRWTIYTDQLVGLDYLMIGASNSYGMFAGSNSLRYGEAAAAAAGKTISHLSGFDLDTATAAGLLGVYFFPGFAALQPRKIIIQTVANSIAHGAAASSYQADYETICANARNAGIGVVHTTPIARNGIDCSVFLSFLNSFYPGEPVCDLFAVTKASGSNDLNPAYDMGDGTHMNPAGHAACAAALAAYM